MKRRAQMSRKSCVPLSRRFRRLSVEALETRRLLALDFGDAPPPYPVVEAIDGARHEVSTTWAVQERILGNGLQAYSGGGLAVSGDGSRIVVVAVNNHTYDLYVKTLERNQSSGNWDVVSGNTFPAAGVPAAAGSVNSFTVSLNDAGTTLALGHQEEHGSVSLRGGIEIYDWTNSSWVQRGETIYGEQENEFSFVADLSDDGLSITIGGHGYIGDNAARGSFRVFDWTGATWTLRGTRVTNPDQQADPGYFGYGVAMSGDGQTVLVSDIESGGMAYVFRWSPENDEWQQLGSILAPDDAVSFATDHKQLTITPDGNTFAIGDRLYQNGGMGPAVGAVFIYQWDNNALDWVQKGPKILGVTGGFGTSLSLDDAGELLAVGNPEIPGNGTSKGLVRLYAWSGSDWSKIETLMHPLNRTGAEFGAAVELSGDGTTLVASAPKASGDYYFEGVTSVFQSTPSLALGMTVTTEANAQIGGDQGDDGVTFLGNIQGGEIGSVEVSVQGTLGYLDAWLDFNQDGNWYGTGEQIFSSQKVLPGINTLEFNIPANVVPGQTHARFRLSESGGLLPTGLATSGEVEDYSVIINSMQLSSVRSQNLAVSIEEARLKATDTLTQESILDIPESDVPAELLFFGDDGYENDVLFDQLSPPTLVDGHSPRTFRFDGGESQNNTATINTGDSHWAWISSQPSVSRDTTVAVKDRTDLLDTFAFANVDEVLISGVDRIEFTDPYFEIGQQSFDFNAAKPLNLPTDTTIAGGSLSSSSSLGLHSAESFVGYGTVNAPFAGTRGSLIEASGNLAIGDTTSSAGFNTDGLIEVGPHTITLNDANEATLGELLTLGVETQAGSLIAKNGLTLNFGRNIEGYGTVDTTNGETTSILLNNGSIVGNSPEEPITLTATVKGVGTMTNVVLDGTFTPGFSPTLSRNGDVVYGDRNTIEIELGGHLPGSEYDRIEHQSAFLDGKLKVLLIDGYTPHLGTELEILKSVTEFQGAFDLIDVPEFLNGLRIEEILDASTITLEAVFDVADELHVVQTNANTFEITDWDGNPLEVLGSTFRARVTPDDQFRSEDSWINDGHFMKGETLVQTVTDGVNRIEIEGSRWKNFVSPYDITNDGKTSVLDALTIINELARGSFVDLDTNQLRSPGEVSEWPGIYYDTNGDDRGTVLDALLVINELARTGNSSGEGEFTDAAIQDWSRDLTPISIANQTSDPLTLNQSFPSPIPSFSRRVGEYVTSPQVVDAEYESMGSESLKAIDESLLNLLAE